MSTVYDYRGFKREVEDKRRKAAAFYRADLHVHTIGSPASDYPSVHTKPGFVQDIPEDEKGLRDDTDAFVDRFVQAAKEKNLSIVAVTDHNEADMAERLSKLSDDELMILPGIEISVQTGLFPDSTVHIVGIFPPKINSKTIDKVFPAGCGMPQSGQRDMTSRTTINIEQLIALIKSPDLGGLCIAAHVDTEKGLRTLFRMQDRRYLQAKWLYKELRRRKSEEGLSPSETVQLQQLEQQLSELPNDMQNQYLSFLADHDFDAIQIQDWKKNTHYRGEHTDALDLPPFVCIVASDAHTLADIGCEGHCTHIKLSELSLDNIKKAFRDPDVRIRYDCTVPHQSVSRVLGVSFEGGVFDEEVIGFSDNLTTLIGGRGTGKSATVEALRYVFHQPIDYLPDRLQNDIKERLSYTLSDTTVKLLFEDTAGQAYVLKRGWDESKTGVFDLDGQPLPEVELPSSRLVRAEVYGWSEIESLSDSPRKQLDLLDRYIPESVTLKHSIREKLERLRSNGNRVVGLAREIQGLLPMVADAAEVEAELERLRNPELDSAFQKWDRNGCASQSLSRILKAVEDLQKWMLTDPSAPEHVGEHEADDNRSKVSIDLVEAISSGDQTLVDYEWWPETKSSLDRSSEIIDEIHSRLLEALSSTLSTIKIAQDRLVTEANRLEAELNALTEESGQAGFHAAVARRRALSARSLEIEGNQGKIDAGYDELRELLKQRSTSIVPDLQEARRALFEARSSKARSIADKLDELDVSSKVHIDILHLQDYQEFRQALGFKDGQSRTSGLLKGIDRHYLSKDYPGYYSQRFTPHDFVSLFLDESADIQNLSIRYVRTSTGTDKGKIVRIVEGEIQEQGDRLIEREDGTLVNEWDATTHEYIAVADAARIWNHLSPWFYENETHDYPDPGKLENLLALEVCDIEDKPSVTLDGKPISGLSPGQRCSALIPIVLVEGEAPLVIDQPEDNLDNELVFDLVVDILRRLKEQRQVIVATHNPNIPVSGDAEQVIVLRAPSKDRCVVSHWGSIDDETVIDQIKAIMEGGDRAFDMRVKKYGIGTR